MQSLQILYRNNAKFVTTLHKKTDALYSGLSFLLAQYNWQVAYSSLFYIHMKSLIAFLWGHFVFGAVQTQKPTCLQSPRAQSMIPWALKTTLNIILWAINIILWALNTTLTASSYHIYVACLQLDLTYTYTHQHPHYNIYFFLMQVSISLIIPNAYIKLGELKNNIQSFFLEQWRIKDKKLFWRYRRTHTTQAHTVTSYECVLTSFVFFFFFLLLLSLPAD